MAALLSDLGGEQQQPEVVAFGGEHGVDGVAVEVSAQPVLTLGVADGGLDRRTSPQGNRAHRRWTRDT
jgi:hypothetical protein